MVEKIKAVKKTPDAFPATLKFFKLVRFSHSDNEEFPGASASKASGRRFLQGHWRQNQ
jgi:hypothetical protein